MIHSRSDLISSPFSFVKENSVPSHAEMTRSKVIGVVLIVFGIIAACAFTACVAAAVVMGSAPLAIGAGAVALLSIGVIISSVFAYRTKSEKFLFEEDLGPVSPVIVQEPSFAGIVHVNVDQNLRPSVPQHSLKRASSGRFQVNIPRTHSNLSRAPSNLNGHVIPGSRNVEQGHVQVGSR